MCTSAHCSTWVFSRGTSALTTSTTTCTPSGQSSCTLCGLSAGSGGVSITLNRRSDSAPCRLKYQGKFRLRTWYSVVTEGPEMQRGFSK
ncbi:hypothetical protein INR49_006899 [Caranx melampygus]|nr:hypothetical protein INR49_006899 [Caranx melampygus]